MQFKTHTGQVIEGQELQEALNKVSNEQEQLAYAIKAENAYADHVTEQMKLDALNRGLKLATEIKQGKHNHAFWCWQRINQVLTGECVGFLPNSKAV
jgi:hypothetical protein